MGMILEIEMVIYLLRKKIEKEGMIHPTPRKKMKHLQERRTRKKEMTVKRRYQGEKARKVRKEAKRMRALMKIQKVRREREREREREEEMARKLREKEREIEKKRR